MFSGSFTPLSLSNAQHGWEIESEHQPDDSEYLEGDRVRIQLEDFRGQLKYLRVDGDDLVRAR